MAITKRNKPTVEQQKARQQQEQEQRLERLRGQFQGRSLGPFHRAALAELVGTLSVKGVLVTEDQAKAGRPLAAQPQRGAATHLMEV